MPGTAGSIRASLGERVKSTFRCPLDRCRDGRNAVQKRAPVSTVAAPSGGIVSAYQFKSGLARYFSTTPGTKMGTRLEALRFRLMSFGFVGPDRTHYTDSARRGEGLDERANWIGRQAMSNKSGLPGLAQQTDPNGWLGTEKWRRALATSNSRTAIRLATPPNGCST